MDITRFALDAIQDNPIVKLGQIGIQNLVRSEPFQQIRNAVLERTPLGLPEKTFIKSMTGGDKVTPGGIKFSDDQLSRIKQVYKDQKDPLRRPTVRDFDPNLEQFTGMSPTQLEKERMWYNENIRKYDNDRLAEYNSPFVHTYGSPTVNPYGRDLKMTLGGFSMTPTHGGMRIQDTWEIDPAEQKAKEEGEKVKEDSVDHVDDLWEGGSIPALIYNAARGLGTYEPITIDQTIPKEDWNSITPRETTLDERREPNQGPALQRINNIYQQIFK